MFLQQLINGISVGGVYALISSGYALIYSLLGFSNWAHGEVAMIGAYIAFTFVASVKLPFVVAIILGILGAGIISVLNEKIAYKKIRDHHSPTMFLMIAAMGLSTTFQNAIMVIFGSKFKIFPQLFSTQSINIGNFSIGVLDLMSLIIAIVAIAILEFVLNKTKYGLGIRSVASNSYTASLMGINIDRYYTLVFLIAGLLAGAAGILYGMKYNVYPTMGNVALKGFISSILGGLGSVRGAVVGAVILGVVETMISAYFNSSLRDLVTFSLLIIVLIIRPQGLMGKEVKDKA